MFRRKNSLENANFIQKVAEEDRRDKILEEAFLQSAEENPYLKRVQANVALCYALMDEKRLEFGQRKRDQIRHLNNKDLRQLEVQLRAAYVSKAVAAQRFEKDALAIADKARQRTLQDTRLAKARPSLIEYAKDAKKEAVLRKAEVKRQLLEQIASIDAERMRMKMERMREVEMANNTIKKNKEDIAQEERDKQEKKRRLKIEMDEFVKVQAIHKAREKALNEAGLSEDLWERIRKRDLQKQETEQKKLDLQKRKNEISDYIGKRTFEIQEKKHKVLDTLIDLLIDERKAKEDIKQMQEVERKKQIRINIRHDLDRLHEEKLNRRSQQKKSDENYKNQISQYLEARNNVQQQLDENKKKKVLEHRRALMGAFDEKKKFRAEEMKRNLMILDYEISEQNRKRLQVENERGEMLRVHMPHLIGFLPARMLRESDKKYISNLKQIQ